jgi:hypothetical protein
VEAGSEGAHGQAITVGLVLHGAVRVVATVALLFTVYAFVPGTEKTTSVKVLIFALVLAALIMSVDVCQRRSPFLALVCHVSVMTLVGVVAVREGFTCAARNPPGADSTRTYRGARRR